MAAFVTFLKPSRIKLVFLVEWALFISISAMRGEMETTRQALVALYPLLFFYLVACILAATSVQFGQVASGWRLWVWGAALVALDQAIKTTVTVLIPHQTSIPVLGSWLSVAHEQNPHGSWIASTLSLRPVNVLAALQWGLAILVLPLVIVCHRYYVARHRKSLWADVASVGLFAGYASWICDMALRGHIVDFIQLPGVVTADVKDFLVTIGAAALFAEALDNPELSWHWGGWRKEQADLAKLLADLCSFAFQDIRGVIQSLHRRFGQRKRR